MYALSIHVCTGTRTSKGLVTRARASVAGCSAVTSHVGGRSTCHAHAVVSLALPAWSVTRTVNEWDPSVSPVPINM